MSTKATINSGMYWHFYEDSMDNQLHLEIMGSAVDFTAEPNLIDVVIPLEIAQAIGIDTKGYG